MQAVKIFRDGQYLDESTNHVQGNNIVQVIKNEHIEIDIYHAPSGSIGGFAPKVTDSDLEIYYLISGSMTLYQPGGIESNLLPGDFMTLSESDLYYPVSFNEDTSLMMIVTRPQFEITKSTFSKLTKILNDLQLQDGDTLDHCQRVCKLSMAIAIETHYDFTKLRSLFFASKFHDVGKAQIPLDILIKPGKLTDEQYAIMKSHVVFSSDMVEPYFGKEIAEIILEHHEHLDGSGYPLGITSKDIHPASKIIAVADGFDAMVTTRPYHKGISNQEAIDELLRCDGQYDQEVVQGLITYLKKHGQL